MGKRCFTQSTWIDSKDTTFEIFFKKKKKEEKEEEEEEMLARLKTWKGGLGKS